MQAIELFYNDSAAQTNAAGAVGANKNVDKKLGEIWESYKGMGGHILVT